MSFNEKNIATHFVMMQNMFHMLIRIYMHLNGKKKIQ